VSGVAPGTVLVEGLVEGPASSWNPDPAALAGALKRAGAPATCLTIHEDGGRRALEPGAAHYPRGQFASDPAEALALALTFLFEGNQGKPPTEWFSTLRVTEYGERTKRETLIAFAPDGVRSAGGESAWAPPPSATGGGMRALAARWPLVLLVVAALGVVAWLKRDDIEGWFHKVGATIGGEDPAKVAVEAGSFSKWVDVKVGKDSNGLFATVAPRAGFPADAAAIDALRPTATLEERAALSAFETGRLRLVLLESKDGGTTASKERVDVDLKPLRKGETARASLETSGRPVPLAGIRLEP
jgi:hypothetical protein